MMTITSVKFTNFKALRDYSVSLKSVNILVGPNNCGKSTVLSAFRVLEYALRIANARRATRVVNYEGHPTNGHIVPENNLPISIENVHTDYTEESSKIEFKIGNSKSLTLFFSNEGGCVLYWNTAGRPTRSNSRSGKAARNVLC